MGAGLERFVRAGWPVLAGVLAGLAAGAIWTWAQPERHRAEARVLLRGAAASRVVPAVEALAESSLVEQNVAQTLRLSRSPHVSAKRGEGGIITVSVEAATAESARQIDAEVVVVLTQKVAQRFGSAPRVEATVLDPAHPVEQTSPSPGRNLLVAGLIGLAVGAAAALTLARRRPEPMFAGPADPSVERRLRKRIDEVAKRERALAKHAGKLAAREQELERRVAVQRREPAAFVASEPVAQPRSSAPDEHVMRQTGGWNLNDLRRRVEGQVDAPTERLEEWNTYLFFLRDHAAIDGALPSSFDGLIADVFGDLFAGPSQRGRS